MKLNFTRVFNLILSFLLLFSMLLPVAFTGAKIGVIGLLLALVLVIGVHRNIMFDVSFLLLSVLFSTIGLIWVNIGLMNGNPGAQHFVPVLVVYPLLFYFLIYQMAMTSPDSLHRFFVLASFFVASSQLLFILSVFGFFPAQFHQVINSIYPNTSSLAEGQGYFLFSIPNVSTSIFLICYFSSQVLLSDKFDKINAAILLILLGLILMTGRRAIFVSLAFTIIFVSIFCFLFRIKSRLLLKRLLIFGSFVPVCLALLAIKYGLDLTFLEEGVASIFNFSNDNSNLERVYQFYALMDGVFESPFFGQGAGAAASYVRSHESPWNYELFYVNFLFQFGVIGFCIYFLGFSFVFIKLALFARGYSYEGSGFAVVLSVLGGVVGFMVANATNPYLLKFDYMWVFFIMVFCLLKLKPSQHI